jgi:hypothetical protein
VNQRFGPLDLDSRTSLNSTRLASLDVVEPVLRGTRALELLSAAAVAASIRASATVLKLEIADRDDRELLPEFDKCLVASDLAVREAARRQATPFGRYLGYLLATLRLDASAPETRAYREHWSRIGRVWLAGGLASGNLGHVLSDVSSQVLEKAGSRLDIQVAPRPGVLPLIGAARCLTATDGVALVYDFGGTTAKHGLGTYVDGKLIGLRLLPPISTPASARMLAEDEAAVGHTLAVFICNSIVQDWGALQSEGKAPLRKVTASVASYVKDNHPEDYTAAGYMTLRHIAPNAGKWLTKAISARVGHDIDLTLMHDGTAAARTFAGQDNTAVILLGTWLGVGFAPPSQDGLRPLAPELQLV